VGWAFFAEGLLNALGGVFNLGTFANGFSLIALPFGAGALFCYGYLIFNRQSREIYLFKP
jgi:hypothetical protein